MVVNLVYVKLRGLATKIRFWSKTCMIQPRIHCGISLMTLRVQLVNWQCWVWPYPLHSVCLVWLLHLSSAITKSCQQQWPIHSCSFYNAAH